jgi:hypothetical protein
VLANVAEINLGDPNAGFTFTSRSADGQDVLRCSGCHTLGGPILKEMEAPHNDSWRTDRALPFGSLKPDAAVAGLFGDASDASNLAAEVKRGIDRLIEARHTSRLSLRQRLRSLFSTMEINLVSDSVPFVDRVNSGASLELPAAFFVDARLLNTPTHVPADVRAYQDALGRVDSRFPTDATASSSRESHHAFLVPARSYIDNRVIGGPLSGPSADRVHPLRGRC